MRFPIPTMTAHESMYNNLYLSSTERNALPPQRVSNIVDRWNYQDKLERERIERMNSKPQPREEINYEELAF